MKKFCTKCEEMTEHIVINDKIPQEPDGVHLIDVKCVVCGNEQFVYDRLNLPNKTSLN